MTPRLLIDHNPHAIGRCIAEWCVCKKLPAHEVTSCLHGAALAYAFLLEINRNQAPFSDAVADVMRAGSQRWHEMERITNV